MSDGYSKDTIEDLTEKLGTLRVVNDAEKIAPILMSKSMLFLSGEIASLKQGLAETIRQTEKRMQDVIDSNNRLTIAQWAYAVAMLVVSGVIAIGALVQSGIIKLHQ